MITAVGVGSLPKTLTHLKNESVSTSHYCTPFSISESRVANCAIGNRYEVMYKMVSIRHRLSMGLRPVFLGGGNKGSRSPLKSGQVRVIDGSWYIPLFEIVENQNEGCTMI